MQRAKLPGHLMLVQSSVAKRDLDKSAVAQVRRMTASV